MEVNILKAEKNDLEVELETITLAEILRVYLNKDNNVEFAAWRRDHPTQKPVLKLSGKSPKKALKDAISLIVKDLEKTEKEFSKLK